MEEPRSQVVAMQLEGGAIVRVRASALDGSEDVVDIEKILPFKEVTDTIEGIAEAVVTTLQKIKPGKASVEFGVEVAIESKGLTALLAKATGTGNLKVTLEWGK